MANTPLTNLDTVASTDRTAAGSQPDFSTPTGTIVSGTTGNVVTSVTASAPLSATGGATPNIYVANQVTHAVLIGPVSGPSAVPSFRTLDATDIPALAYLGTNVDAPLSGTGTSANHLAISKATTSVSGYLSATDFTTFNGKLSAVTANTPITGSGTSGSPLTIPAATSTDSGYLKSTDWNTFNGKQAAFTSQDANKLFGGPGSGPSATPNFRLLVAADIPASLNATTINGIYNVGYLQQARVGYGTGANIQINFDLGAFADVGLTVNASFSPSGSAGVTDGKTQDLVLRNITGGVLTLAWNSSWVIAGPALPTSLAAGAAIRVFLTCNGTAESNIVATYVAAASGTVTSVAVTAANGVSGTVANSTTAANITLTLGDISAATSKPSATGAVARSFGLRDADVFNVKDFGAKGDSTTNDTSAIQAATNAAAAVNGCVYLPSGNYKITSAITLPQPFYGVVSFKGDGSRQSTLIQATGAANGIYADLSKTVQAANMSYGYTYAIQYVGSSNFTASGIDPASYIGGNALTVGTTYMIFNQGSSDFTTVGASSNTNGTVFTATGTDAGGGTSCGHVGKPVVNSVGNSLLYCSPSATSGTGYGSDIILKRKNAVNIYNLGFTCANGINPGIAIYLDYGPGTISTEMITGCVVEDVYVGQYTDAGNLYNGGWTSALVMRNAWHFRVHGLDAIGYSNLSTGFTGPGSGYAVRLKGGVNGSIMSVQANYWSYGIVIEPDVPNTDPDPQGITVSDIITVEVDNPIVTRKTGYTTGAIDVEFSSMLIDNGNNPHANPAVQLQACSAGTIITNTFVLLVGATNVIELAYCEDCVIQGVEVYGPVTNGVHLKDGTKNTLISNNSFRGQTNPVNIESNCYGNRVIENIVASPGDAGGMQANRVYVITSAGSTSFTSYGAPSNSAGTIFIATGAGTGTGTVDDMTFTVSNSGGASNVVKGSFTGCVALVQKASDTSISSGSSVHIPFGTTIFDDVGFVDSGNYKLKIPQGVYAVRLSANVTWENNSSSYRFVSIRKNGSSIVASQLQVANLNSQINISSPVIKVTAGDYFEFFAEQGTGSGLVISASEQTWFSIEVIK
jgi:hypothetical protein